MLALRGLVEVEFHTFFPEEEAIKANFGERAVAHLSDAAFSFRYLHPLAAPQLIGCRPENQRTIRLTCENGLRFGCVEGQFQFVAENAVYDPQGSGESFSANGSTADRLAIVLNEGEAAFQTGCEQPHVAAKRLLEWEVAEVVIIKRGAVGCLVATRSGEITDVPAFQTDRLFKIGSGDIFTAAFAHAWMVQGRSAKDAALFASQHAAHYVDTRIVELPRQLPAYKAVTADPSGLSVLIVSDQRSLPDHWLAWEAKRSLESLGVKAANILEPFEFDMLNSILDEHHLLLALPTSSGGLTMAAVDGARRSGVPFQIFCDRDDLAVPDLVRSAHVFSDFAACLYNALWRANEGASLLRRN